MNEKRVPDLGDIWRRPDGREVQVVRLGTFLLLRPVNRKLNGGRDSWKSAVRVSAEFTFVRSAL